MIERSDIEAAAARITSHVRRTPVMHLAGGLGLGLPLTLKLELFQHTGSFKPRGAFNRILSALVPEAGVIAASGGNHAQAVAYAAQQLGFPAEIFVPETAPRIKVDRLRTYGAAIRQVGSVYDEAREACEERAAQSGALVVHAYDQSEIVAGAGTLGRELAEQCSDLDTVLVAVGGGGLIGGVAAWFHDDVRIVAVEPERCPTLHAALREGEPTTVDVGGLASDSLAARKIGAIPFACARRFVDESVLVADEAIEAAQALLWAELRLVVEPGGATSLAALLTGAYRSAEGEKVCALVCGANTDPKTFV